LAAVWSQVDRERTALMFKDRYETEDQAKADFAWAASIAEIGLNREIPPELIRDAAADPALHGALHKLACIIEVLASNRNHVCLDCSPGQAGDMARWLRDFLDSTDLTADMILRVSWKLERLEETLSRLNIRSTESRPPDIWRASKDRKRSYL